MASLRLWQAAVFARRLFRRARPALPAAAANAGLEARIRQEVAATGRAVRVGFVVNDRAKWSGDPLLNTLRQADGFECGLVCTLSDTAFRMRRKARAAHYALQRAFFADIGPIWGDLYDPVRDRVAPAKTVAGLGCDVVFLQQPWGMKDFPRLLLGRALCAYSHYGFVVMDNGRMQFGQPDFHPYLWRYIAQTEAHGRAFARRNPDNAAAVLVAGYPKLDVYREPAPPRGAVGIWPNAAAPNRPRVVFAPHHALGRRPLGMATFRWSAKPMLALARETPGTDWVYKPHPNLAFELERERIMGSQEYAAYLDAWAGAANGAVYDDGRYFDLFRTSDALITDCGSFLAEYLPTGRPIIWLVSKNTVGLSDEMAGLERAFYKVRSPDALRAAFHQVVLGGEDPLRMARSEMIGRVMPSRRAASKVVLEHLRQVLAVPGV